MRFLDKIFFKLRENLSLKFCASGPRVIRVIIPVIFNIIIIITKVVAFCNCIYAYVCTAKTEYHCHGTDKAWRAQEGSSGSGGSSLQGIKIHGASFCPRFPDIEPQDCVFSDSCDSYTKQQTKDEENKENNSSQESKIWKDFTAIIESNTPFKSNHFNFTNNFSNINTSPSAPQSTKSNFDQQKHFLRSALQPLPSNVAVSATLDPSLLPTTATFAVSGDTTPVFDEVSLGVDDLELSLSDDCSESSIIIASRDTAPPTTSVAVKMPANAGVGTPANATLLTGGSLTTLATPESVSVDTPDRLFDLNVLRTRLASLKTLFGGK